MQHRKIQTFVMDAVNEWDFALPPSSEDACVGRTKKKERESWCQKKRLGQKLVSYSLTHYLLPGYSPPDYLSQFPFIPQKNIFHDPIPSLFCLPLGLWPPQCPWKSYGEDGRAYISLNQWMTTWSRVSLFPIISKLTLNKNNPLRFGLYIYNNL